LSRALATHSSGGIASGTILSSSAR
jgi:hypothetical protein